MNRETGEIHEICKNVITAISNEKAEFVDIISNGLGYVSINTTTKDFTYFDKFGNDVLNTIIKTKCINNLPQKIACLAAIMYAYRETGGFVFLETLK